MLGHESINIRHLRSMAAEVDGPIGGSDGAFDPPSGLDRRPRLRVRFVGEVSVVTFVNAETLLDPQVVRELGEQLFRLVDQGRTRLVLNFGGVTCMSCEVVGKLVCLHQKVEQARGFLCLCGLDPMMRNMLRICRLERVFAIYDDEAAALEGETGVEGRSRVSP